MKGFISEMKGFVSEMKGFGCCYICGFHISFHTAAYRRNFIDTVFNILGDIVVVSTNVIEIDGRHVRVGVFPIGVWSICVIVVMLDALLCIGLHVAC